MKNLVTTAALLMLIGGLGCVAEGGGSASGDAAVEVDAGPDGVDAVPMDAALDAVAADARPEPDAGPPDAGLLPSPGCGRAASHPLGGVQVSLDVGPAGDGLRGYYLVLPENYDPDRAHRLVIGYAGTNWVGEQIRPYLQLEDGQRDDEIFVYPDPLWHDFEGWGSLGGWLLGPHAFPAHGDQDLVFTEAILDTLSESYCIDPERVFVTGHSWGGDMAQVAACFLGDRVRAAVPVAANRPYWFEPEGQGNGWVECEGEAAVWTLFGAADDHFQDQPFSGAFGDQCRDFWLDARGCEGSHAYDDLGYGAEWECVDFRGCSAVTRYCLYDGRFGHQIPDYYPQLTMQFFRSF